MIAFYSIGIIAGVIAVTAAVFAVKHQIIETKCEYQNKSGQCK